MFGMLAEFPDLRPEFFQIMTDVMMEILRAAVARGELAHADVTPRVATLAVDLLRYEGLKAGRPRSSEISLDDLEALVSEIVDDIYLPLIRAVAGSSDHDPVGPRLRSKPSITAETPTSNHLPRA